MITKTLVFRAHTHTRVCVPNDFSTQTLKKIKLLSDSGALAPSGFQGKCVVRQELILYLLIIN